MKKLISALFLTAFLVGCGNQATPAEVEGNDTLQIENGGSITNTGNREIVRRHPEVDPHQVIGTYNGHAILAMDFIIPLRQERAAEEQQMAMIIQWIENREPTEEDFHDFWYAALEDGTTQMDHFREYILQRAIEEATMLAIALDHGFSYDPEEIAQLQQELDDMVQEMLDLGMNPYQLFYDSNGISIEDFARIQKNSLTIFAFISDLLENATVTPEEVETFMAAHGPANIPGVEVTVGHILLNLDNWDEEEAYAFANVLAQRLRDGEDMNTLAREYSEDPGVQRPEAAFYTFDRGMMVPEFDAWSFRADAQPGDIGVVRTDFGYHIMMFERHENLFEMAMEIVEVMKAEEALLQLMEAADIQWDMDEALIATIE